MSGAAWEERAVQRLVSADVARQLAGTRESPAKAPARKLATRYRCISASSIAGHHTSGNGKPARKKCAYCGGQFYAETGLYGVFHWVPQATVNDYAEGKALHTSHREAPMQKITDDAYAASADSDLVVRWIYLDA
jgi:hypothetical protein